MFNPYVARPEEALRPARPEPPESRPGALEGLLRRLGRMEKDDLLILAMVYLLAREGEDDRLWPLVAAGLYLMM